ncbi:hypothetical protein PF005_g27894 [Phytophthora fragariae]|uniref:Uncharacterized protein n=1 Tax=Phytophthora fragariae TaxID=53985 RepID=A0A6A4BIU1_9STRA|nr:hypothetical protein PF003_g18262 [Phytophthora fragariae]KAE8921296.1 hypothetical protein PF009_g28421 [Phytophthora fragariae]KAE9080699.1 hypothetical protein PF006_g27264 [Phytophthora fragariae]KAE9114532.1 hypothetical protein PF007_g10351 [Phytophthora fragariae]KAE9114872.1 hypothetical protein PF010_g9562 [Phytophthora fragariae]
MKFSSVLAFATAIEAGVLLSAAQTVTIVTDNECAFCAVGTYCTPSVPACHGPPLEGWCLSEITSEYVRSCEDGYECFDSRCECVIDDTPTVTPTTAPTDAPTSAPTSAPATTPAPTAVGASSYGMYTGCPNGTYWEIDASACRGPSYYGECYNPATAKYQNGCAPGFTCINNKCSTIPPATFSPSVCYLKCTESDEYCENGTNFCRGPKYAGECFNPATGRFRNGCGAGFECANNLCVKA